MKINVVLNGGAAWICNPHPNTHVSTIALDVMKRAEIGRGSRALMDWEMRDVKGDDVAFYLSLKRLNIRDGQTLYLSPRPGAGA